MLNALGVGIECCFRIPISLFLGANFNEFKNDEEVWKLIQNLQQYPSTYDTFSLKNDSLWYKYHLYIWKNSQLKQKIILEFHTSPLGENSGFLKTYHRVKKDFFLDGLESDI